MQEILAAASPYGLIKEAEGLITTVGTANTALRRRTPPAGHRKIDAHIATLDQDIEAAKGDAGLGRRA